MFAHLSLNISVCQPQKLQNAAAQSFNTLYNDLKKMIFPSGWCKRKKAQERDSQSLNNPHLSQRKPKSHDELTICSSSTWRLRLTHTFPQRSSTLSGPSSRLSRHRGPLEDT